MSVDGKAERTAIKTRSETVPMAGGRVLFAVPEEAELERDDFGLVRPYILLTFGSLFPVEGESTIEGFEQQPQNMPVIWECWAARAEDAMDLAGEVRAHFLGWAPNDDNASMINLRSGGFFDRRDTAGRPVRWMESVVGVLTINNSFELPDVPETFKSTFSASF